jgi:hypothetical protein
MEASDIAAYLIFKKLVKERKTTMSSVVQTDKGLFSTFLATHHISSEDEGTDKPEEAPAEEVKSAFQQGGYQPTRASWHTLTGKIKSYLA